MNEIMRHIEYLLRSHECVVVPGFGAFIKQYHSARYDAESRIFYPPFSSVVFNSSLTHNDGLLAASIARRDSVSFERASKTLSDEVATMKTQLQADGELVAGHLGHFTCENGKTVFHPQKSYSYSPENYGLEPIEISLIADRKTNEGSKPEGSRPVFIDIRRYLKVAASIAVILMMGILFSTPVMIDRSKVNYASISLPEISAPQAASVAEFIDLNIKAPSETEGFALADTTYSSVSIKTRFDDSDQYYLVVASLANRRQAETFVRQHEGKCRLQIIERTGKTRVIAATGSSAGEAMEPTSLPEFSKHFPDAWPCHR